MSDNTNVSKKSEKTTKTEKTKKKPIIIIGKKPVNQDELEISRLESLVKAKKEELKLLDENKIDTSIPATIAEKVVHVPTTTTTIKQQTEQPYNKSTQYNKNTQYKKDIPSSTIPTLLELYLKNVVKDSPTEEIELEIKYGTYGVKPISKISFNNTIQTLLSHGFEIKDNVYLLRIQSEYDDKNGSKRMSTIRSEINGLNNIQTYCQTNNISTIENGLSYIQKTRFDNDVPPANVNDYNFRITLSKETKMDEKSQLIRSSIIDKWKDNKKTFRYLNRCKLIHPYYPVVIDMSIVKESKKQGRFYIPEYNIHDSSVFTSPEKYEIEIEFINSQVGVGTEFNTVELLNTNVLKPVVKHVLSGLQETKYPVSYPEQTMVLQEYMKLLWGKEYIDNMKIIYSNFVGPSSITLQKINILPTNSDISMPNIRDKYTVTDKADGDRKLLFIAPNGKIYLINTNMEVQFTGTHAKNKETWNSLIDGEHILHDKHKKFLNMYAAFDIYYINGKDIRSKAFSPTNDEEEITNFRLPLLQNILKQTGIESVVNPTLPVPLKVTSKQFYFGNNDQSIFYGCSMILKKETDGLFEYNTDGLIFTPANKGVGSDKIGEYIKPYKKTWKHSFKWKPAEFNTIDFLVTLKKNDNGNDFIGNLFESGINANTLSQIQEYKTAILRVGFDENEDGYINPSQDVIDDKIPTVSSHHNFRSKKNYVPMQFFPTEPSDNKAGICNLLLKSINNTEKYMYTQENEIIEDNMIVEFSYNRTNKEEWRWSPLRVRYDKTAQYRSGGGNFGNAYHVANSNWHSIHDPITPDMLKTGENITLNLSDDDVYYNKVSGVSKTGALRDFHNLYVKSILINTVSKPGDTLIDLAVGKGGDWPKWINSKLKFIFGVDISRDNIQNRLNGAYARYLTYRKQYHTMPHALFVNGNSSVNIRNTTGILNEKDKQITRAVFGQGPKDAKQLGLGVYKQYGVASEGFDICSIQFALHYMFENQETLHNFLQNVSEVTKEGGYFIGSCYDGNKMFNMLKNIETNKSKVIFAEDITNTSDSDKKKIWEVTKKYDNDEFLDNETCVGYAIDVFQESINKTIREYLVNFTYLTRILENYGFVPITSDELTEIHHSKLKTGVGMFDDLFHEMNTEIKEKRKYHDEKMYKNAPNMSFGEKTISFLNRYFIYKKIRKVSDADKVSANLQKQSLLQEDTDPVNKLTNKPSALIPEAASSNNTIIRKKITSKKTVGVNPKQSVTEQSVTEQPAREQSAREQSVIKKLKRSIKL